MNAAGFADVGVSEMYTYGDRQRLHLMAFEINDHLSSEPQYEYAIKLARFECTWQFSIAKGCDVCQKCKAMERNPYDICVQRQATR